MRLLHCLPSPHEAKLRVQRLGGTKRLKLTVFIGLALVSAITAGARFTSPRLTKAAIPPTSNPGSTVSPQNSNRRQVEALPITLKQGGFVPREITRSAGYYFLSVNNASGVPEIQLRFDRQNVERIREDKVQKEKPSWRRNVHLTPGTYLLTEANNPRWVCRITITAQ